MENKAWKSGCQLIRAAADGSVDEIAKLLDNGADVNFQRKVSSMTLFEQASTQSVPFQSVFCLPRVFMFSSSLDSAQTEESALMAAAKNNKLAALKLLLERGADIGVQYSVERVDFDCDPPCSYLAVSV